MEYEKASDILQKMHDRVVADAENKEQRVAQLNAEYEAGDTNADTIAGIKLFTSRGVNLRVEAEALSVAIEALWRLEGLDK